MDNFQYTLIQKQLTKTPNLIGEVRSLKESSNAHILDIYLIAKDILSNRLVKGEQEWEVCDAISDAIDDILQIKGQLYG